MVGDEPTGAFRRDGAQIGAVTGRDVNEEEEIQEILRWRERRRAADYELQNPSRVSAEKVRLGCVRRNVSDAFGWWVSDCGDGAVVDGGRGRDVVENGCVVARGAGDADGGGDGGRPAYKRQRQAGRGSFNFPSQALNGDGAEC